MLFDPEMGFGIIVGVVGLIDKIKEDPPFKRPNGEPGNWEWNVKHLTEKIISGILICFVCWLGSWAVSYFGESKIVLLKIDTIASAQIVNNKELLTRLDSMQKRFGLFCQQQDVIGKTLWVHIHPGQPYPLIELNQPFYSEERLKMPK